MSSLLTEFGNMLAVLGAMYGFGYTVYWVAVGRIGPGYWVPMSAVAGMHLYIIYRIGWWVLALSLADGSGCVDPCSPYHPFFVDNKEWAALPGGWLYLLMSLRFVRWVEDHSIKSKWVRFVLFNALAGILVWV